MVLQDGYCEKCDKKYANVDYEWCKCQASDLSGNKTIDNFVKEMHLSIKNRYTTFEWIPYNQFVNIKKISKGGFATVYSAIWKDGPLNYNEYNYEYTRNQSKGVALKYLHNSQNIPNEFLNEV